MGGQDKATAKGPTLSVERYERSRWYGRYWGPSTAQLARSASCFAQDDGVLGRVGKKSEAAVWVIGLLGGQDKATAKTPALSVERYERSRWYGRYWGPSTAQLARSASCFAQDDGVLGWVGKKSEAAVWVIGLLGGGQDKATAKTPALSVERYDRSRWYGRYWGPSTAQITMML